MNENVPYQRELSISSERTLDPLEEIPSVLGTPIHSPGSQTQYTTGQMKRHIGPDFQAGSSRPPHHGRHSPNPARQYDDRRGDENHDHPVPTPRVSWQTPSITEVSPNGTENRQSEFRFEYVDENLSGNPYGSPKKTSDMPKVFTGSESSPIRRLKKKDEEQSPRVERELSDAYIDSISRTPRYDLGRHNTYDDMIAAMNPEDPFKGNYQPSGKSLSEKSKLPKPKKRSKSREKSVDRNADDKAETYPLDNMHTRKKSKRRKKRKGEDSTESTATFTYDNDAYRATPLRKSAVESDQASVKSNGTYTKRERQNDIQTSLVNMTAPILSKSPQKVKSIMRESNEVHENRDELNREVLGHFVKQSEIVQRECKAYVRNMKSPDNSCFCGRDQQWHQMKDIHIESDKFFKETRPIWHYKTHTETEPTDSFGEIQFQGFGQEVINAPYIRLCPKTDLETLWTLLTEHWKLPIPKLLISVTGGAQRFDLNPRLKAVFKRGLINAATTTGAWIITGGTATGVMQFVGDAVRDHLITLGSHETTVVALGIATWGCIANREALDGEGDEGLFPATYSLEDVSEIKGKDVPLDHNHTHFLLVDDGTEKKFGAEIEFRTTFERYVSEKVETGVAESQSVNVPVVMLVVEGGVNTMKTVWQAVQQNIPVLALNGSGRAADFICYGYVLSKDPKNEDKTVFPPGFDEDMRIIALEKFAWKSTDNVDKKIAEGLKQLRDILLNRRLINVFNLSEAETKDIDRAILYALLKANKTNAKAQLSLALAWNRCDIARHEIFTQDNRQYWKNIPLYDAMFTALVQDRVDFVQLFLENGVCMKKFLSIDTLWNLYGNSLSDGSDTMAQLLNNLMLYLKQTWSAYLCCHPTDTNSSDPNLLNVVGKLLIHLLGDEAINPYSDEKFVVKEKTPTLKWLSGNHKTAMGHSLSKHVSDRRNTLGDTIGSESAKRFYKRKRQEYDFNKLAERELFYWAILMNRRGLGKMFWRAGQDQLGSALIACSILKNLAAIADADEELELSIDLQDHAKYFENCSMYEDMAVGVLSECYKKDKMMAHQLLVRRLENYGRTTLFALADTNTLMKFMGHTCCQTKLNLIWKGRMALYTQTWKICLSMLLPFCIPAIKFTTNESMMLGAPTEDNFDDIEEGEELAETQKEDVHIISNKVRTIAASKVMPSIDKKYGNAEEELFVRSKTKRKKSNKKKLYKVQMFSDVRTDSIGVFSAIYYFYTAPVTGFIFNMLSYMVFLSIFTFFLLTDFYPDNPSSYEYLVWGWTVTMFLEEFRQIVANDKRSLWYKIREWFGSMWNQFDLAMYFIFIISVVLRYSLNGNRFVYARVMYSVTLGMYYMRFMQTFFVEKNIGPKVIMIRDMLVDLVFFLGIFIVFMLSFGVMYQANLFPNHPADWNLLKRIIYIPYWQMYGELFLEDMEGSIQDGSTCTSDESVWRADGGADRCPEPNALVPFLAAVYLILTNILLVNLLIAMFSYTFQMVQDKSEQVWRFYRYSLVYEFYDRPMFCPPLIIVSHIYRTVLFVTRKTCSTKKYTNEFKLNLDEKDNNRLMLFVRAATENYLNISQKLQKEELGNKVADTANRIEKVIEELDNIKETVRLSKLTPSSLEDSSVDQTDAIMSLSARRSPMMQMSPRQAHMTASVEAMQDRFNDLSEQVAQNSLQTSQMMAMLEMFLSQQKSRPSHLEIHDMTHFDDSDDKHDP